MGVKLSLFGKKRAKRAAAGGAAKEIDEDEWVKGTSYEVAQRQKATQRNRAAGAARE